MIRIGGKVYRNLQEQVGYNSKQITKIFSILDGIDYEDHVVVIEDISTPLNAEEMAIVVEPVSFLAYQDKLFFKDSSDAEKLYFSGVVSFRGTDVITINSFQIAVSIESGEMELLNETAKTYSSERMDEKLAVLDALIADLASGSPKGVYATLADLETAYPTGADGIYVVSADGHWYYWDGAAWTDGGAYQASEIADDSIVPEKLKDTCFSPLYKRNEILFTKNNVKANEGYYDFQNTHQPSSSNKSVEIDLTDINRNCFLSFTISGGLSTPIGFIQYANDDSWISLGTVTKNNIPLKNIKTLRFNFFDTYTSGFTLTYFDDFRDSLNDNLGFNNIENSKTFTKDNVLCSLGYWSNISTFNNAISHQSVKIPVNNQNILLTYTVNTAINLPVALVEYEDGTSTSFPGSTTGAKSHELKNVKYLFLNFFGGASYVDDFTIEPLQEPVAPVSKDYIRKPFNFSGKKALFVGDSITWGYTKIGGAATRTNHPYPATFSSRVGMTGVNNAVSGATIVDHTIDGYSYIYNQLVGTSDKPTFDYVFIAGGINDWQINSSKADLATEVAKLITYIKANFTNAEIIFITPINCDEVGWKANHATAGQSMSIQECRNIITQIAIENDDSAIINVVQGNNFGFPTSDEDAAFISSMYADSLHPSDLGYLTLYLSGLCNKLL